MEDTTARPIDQVELELRGILDKIKDFKEDNDPNSTAMPLPKDSNDTSSDFRYNNPPIMAVGGSYNRKVSRYAQKHKISCKEAFKRLYK